MLVSFSWSYKLLELDFYTEYPLGALLPCLLTTTKSSLLFPILHPILLVIQHMPGAALTFLPSHHQTSNGAASRERCLLTPPTSLTRVGPIKVAQQPDPRRRLLHALHEKQWPRNVRYDLPPAIPLHSQIGTCIDSPH